MANAITYIGVGQIHQDISANSDRKAIIQKLYLWRVIDMLHPIIGLLQGLFNYLLRYIFAPCRRFITWSQRSLREYFKAGSSVFSKE